MEEKFTEIKKVTSYLNEPIKFKIVPFAKGHSIEVTMNLNWSQVDQMNDKEGPVRQGIANCMTLIVGDLKSTVLRVNRDVPEYPHSNGPTIPCRLNHSHTKKCLQ